MTSIILNPSYASQATLEVVPVSVSDFPDLIERAKQWNEIANQKRRLVSSQETFAITQFNSSAFIALHTADWLSQDVFPQASSFPSVLQASICRDLKGEVQGMMVLSEIKEAVKIECLMTHPRNITSSINDKEPGRIKGVGKTLVKHAEQMALFLDKQQVKLMTLASTATFYEQIGYQYESVQRFAMYKAVCKTEQLANSLQNVA